MGLLKIMLVNDKEQKIIQKIQEITGKNTNINQQVCYEQLKDFREYQIKKILIISSSFDYFILEEEGRLNALFSDWCGLSENQNPPEITHVETLKETLKKIKQERYDLIIIFKKPQDTTINIITDKIKEITDVSIVFLDNDLKE